MDLGVIRGIGTIVLFVSFIALVIWAYTPGRRKRFEEAAKLPFLGDDDAKQAGGAR